MTLEAAVFSVFSVAAVIALLYGARRAGLFGPVLAALVVRAAIMVVAHLWSVDAGDRGFMFLDDHGLLRQAAALAGNWREGEFASPRAVVDSYQAGYQVLLAGVLVFTGPHLLAAKLLNVFLGTATVLLTGLVARRLLGDHAARPAAWIAAFLPTLVFWSATGLKESLAGFLVVTCILLVTAIRRLSTVGVLAISLAALFVTRGLSALAIAGAGAIALLWAGVRHRDELSWRQVARYGVVLLAGIGVTVTVLSAGHPHDLVAAYTNTAARMFDRYQGSVAAVPPDLFRTFVSPRPWVFDEAGAQGWYRALYPGMWALYALYPMAALGAWRGRHRPEVVLLVAACLIFLVAHATISGSGIRQRSGIEPLIVLLAVSAFPSPRLAVRLSAAAFGFVAVVSLVDDGEQVVAPIVLTVAGALWWFGGTLSNRSVDFRLLPQPMREIVQIWAGPGRPGPGRAGALGHLRSGRGASPKLERAAPPPALRALAATASPLSHGPPLTPTPPTRWWPSNAVTRLQRSAPRLTAGVATTADPYVERVATPLRVFAAVVLARFRRVAVPLSRSGRAAAPKLERATPPPWLSALAATTSPARPSPPLTPSPRPGWWSNGARTRLRQSAPGVATPATSEVERIASRLRATGSAAGPDLEP